jgi:hypothetical protein
MEETSCSGNMLLSGRSGQNEHHGAGRREKTHFLSIVGCGKCEAAGNYLEVIVLLCLESSWGLLGTINLADLLPNTARREE